jgi:hypothetical protein
MAQPGLVDGLAAVGQRLDRALKVDGVLQDDDGNDEVESACAITLVLEAAIADLGEAVAFTKRRLSRFSNAMTL